MSKAEAPGTDVAHQGHTRGTSFKTFSSLRHRDFRFLWTSSLFASSANWIQQVTLGWLAYDLTGSAVAVGVVQGIRALPFLLIGPIAGVFADRFDRRKSLVATQFFLTVLAAGFSLLVLADLHTIYLLGAFTFLSGSAWAFNNPVRQALVANTVPRTDLMNAVALNSVGFNTTRVLGPVTGGLLIAAFGAGTNFAVQAAAHLGVCLMVLPIRATQEAPAEMRPRESVLESMLGGLRYVRTQEVTLALILVALIPSVFVMPFVNHLLPVFAPEVLGVGADGLGLLLSAFGVGALIGTLTLASLGNVQRKGVLLFTAALLTAVAVIAFSFTRSMGFALPVLGVVGAGHMMYMAVNQSIIHAVTPDQYRGRVMSIYMLDFGLVPVGSLLAGVLAEYLSAPTSVLIGGCTALALFVLTLLRFKVLVRVRA